ncbi:hypothetical protein L3C95_08560 [Chitinophaga filiformis]|uniref:hypothetical protein n=1 Tax=Chitinophaga filiformis TaxID=104663 RepID=UPI001F2806D2|nr:hypothetical protein [Chitinophaga filiformis]MCF6402921.1 hypothetical protein [Chitinophaga filiformis]
MLLNRVTTEQRPFDNLKVFKATYDSVNKTSIIPDSIFSMQPDLLYLTEEFDTVPTTDKYGFEIQWPSYYIDGSYVLTVKKRQIYLCTTHNNPNPNHLIWFANITSGQYEIIANKINREKTLFQPREVDHTWRKWYSYYNQLYYVMYKSEGDKPWEWTEKEREKLERDAPLRRYQNLHALISFLNSGLTADNQIPFMTRADFDKIDPVRIVYSEEDYEAQIKIVPREAVSNQNDLLTALLRKFFPFLSILLT